GGQGFPLLLHLLGAELGGLVHLAGMDQPHVLDGHLAAGVVEDRRTLDLDLRCRAGGATDQGQEQEEAEEDERDSTDVHGFHLRGVVPCGLETSASYHARDEAWRPFAPG